jgi:hypothetical protein
MAVELREPKGMAKKKSITQSQDAGSQKPMAGNPWGQYRAPLVKLKRVGDEVIHGQKSANTITELQMDYPALLDEVRQVEQYVSIKMGRGLKPTAEEVIKAFDGKAPFLLGDATKPGYATSKDIEEFVESRESNFSFTRNLMAKGWSLTRSVIDTYLKPSRKRDKKS